LPFLHRSLAAVLAGTRRTIVHGGERETRLHLVGGEARLLLLELLHRDLREVSALALLGVGEACLQRCDALAQRADARSKLTIVLRHVVARALDPYPAALCLVQREAHVLQAAVLLPRACAVRIAETVVEYALHQREPLAHVSHLGAIRHPGERGFHALHPRPLRALGFGAEGGHIVLRLDGAQLILELHVALL